MSVAFSQVFFRVTGHDGDHSAERIVAEQSRCRPAEYFDPGDSVCDQKILPGVGEGAYVELIWNRDPVDEAGDAISGKPTDSDFGLTEPGVGGRNA